MKFTAVSLFSGAGGMDLGAHNAGVDIIFANDIDHDSCETLKARFPKAEVVEGDVASVKTFPKADIVMGGYPCQSFSLGGKRDPEKDKRTYLYLEFARALKQIEPKFFIAENVSGLTGVKGGKFFQDQLDAFQNIGEYGYRISRKIVDAKEYGVPQSRKRVLLVGVRRDLEKIFIFPDPTHGSPTTKFPDLLPFASHGEVIKDLPLNPEGEYYHRPHDPDGGFSWYFMSRNRKSDWDKPSYTIVANWRHTTLHPASPSMKMVWSDLKNGFKQKWEFTNEYEHIKGHPERQTLEKPRRLSWRECARIQTFPDNYPFVGKVQSKIQQIGNAVPVKLAETMFKHLVSGKGLIDSPTETKQLQIFDSITIAT